MSVSVLLLVQVYDDGLSVIMQQVRTTMYYYHVNACLVSSKLQSLCKLRGSR